MGLAEPNWKLFAHLSVEIPVLLLYALAVLACICNSSALESGFYNFIAFIGILDIITYFIMLFSFRLTLYTPFNHFFNAFGDDDMNVMTFIYAGTWTLCCMRELSTTALALNRFSSLIYNNKKWSMRSFVLTVLLCIIGGFACNWYMWDREAEYLKIDMDNGTHFFFMMPDILYREYINEAAVILCWSSAAYAVSMGTYMLIGFHSFFGGKHPDVDGRETRLTVISFAILICDTLFLLFGIMGYILFDLSDFLNAIKMVKDGAPVFPIGHDLRSLCVPLFLVLFDPAARKRMWNPFGKDESKISPRDDKVAMA